DVLVREADAAVDEVLPGRIALGYAEAQHEGRPGGDTTGDLVLRQLVAAAVIAERAPRRLGGRATLGDLLGGAEAAVHLARVEQRLRVGAMPLEVGALEDDVLVPVEPEPLHAFEDRARRLVGGARLVRVLDAQQELAAELAGEEPVEERGAGAADVEVAGGAGGEPKARCQHGTRSRDG